MGLILILSALRAYSTTLQSQMEGRFYTKNPPVFLIILATDHFRIGRILLLPLHLVFSFSPFLFRLA